MNLIQVEIGLGSVFPNESSTPNGDIQTFLKTFVRAQLSNVSVSLVISPCNLAGWTLEKYQILTHCESGPLRICTEGPESRTIIGRFIRHVIPQIEEQQGLHSICLRNEPVYHHDNQCKYAPPAWQD